MIRLISSFEIEEDVNDKLWVDIGGNLEEIQIPAGEHFWSLDDAADDFGDVVETALEGHSQSAASDWTIEIIGVDATSSTQAAGRFKFTNANDDWTFDFDHAGDDTVDPRIFGFAADAGDEASSSQELISDFSHRFGWYPDQEPTRRSRTKHTNTIARVSRGGKLTTRKWGADFWRIVIVLWPVLPALMRLEAAEDSSKAALALLTQNDPNAPLEAFGLDLADGSGRTWRVYPDATDTATYTGPYHYEEGDIWTGPLSDSGEISEAAEHWRAIIKGREAL